MSSPILAMIGALALACFVKVFFAVFLGTPRTAAADHACESPLAMRMPMLVLAAACAIIGLAPVLLTPILDHAVASWIVKPDLPAFSVAAVVPLKMISIMSMLLAVLILFMATLMKRRIRISRYVGTWDCGYALPTARIQYTASSFAQMIVKIFGWVLRPLVHWPLIKGLFPKTTKMGSHVDDVVLDRVIMPMGHYAERWTNWFHRFQQGITQQYVLYILIAVILMMSTIIPFKEFITRLFTR